MAIFEGYKNYFEQLTTLGMSSCFCLRTPWTSCSGPGAAAMDMVPFPSLLCVSVCVCVCACACACVSVLFNSIWILCSVREASCLLCCRTSLSVSHSGMTWSKPQNPCGSTTCTRMPLREAAVAGWSRLLRPSPSSSSPICTLVFQLRTWRYIRQWIYISNYCSYVIWLLLSSWSQRISWLPGCCIS